MLWATELGVGPELGGLGTGARGGAELGGLGAGARAGAEHTTDHGGSWGGAGESGPAVEARQRTAGRARKTGEGARATSRAAEAGGALHGGVGPELDLPRWRARDTERSAGGK